MITGRDLPKHYSGLLLFGNRGQRLSHDLSASIERCMNRFISASQYLQDLSGHFDYSSKKVRFKPDNFTDDSMKSYIADMEQRHLLN